MLVGSAMVVGELGQEVGQWAAEVVMAGMVEEARVVACPPRHLGAVVLVEVVAEAGQEVGQEAGQEVGQEAQAVVAKGGRAATAEYT